MAPLASLLHSPPPPGIHVNLAPSSFTASRMSELPHEVVDISDLRLHMKNLTTRNILTSDSPTTRHVLDCLHISSDGEHTLRSTEEKLPPMKRLILENYNWTHDLEHVDNLWDFSHLETLELRDMEILELFESLQPYHVSKIRHLKFGLQPGTYNNATPTDKFAQCALETLEIISSWSWERLFHKTLTWNLSNLRILRLRDYRITTSLEAGHLSTLQTKCPLLQKLEIDIRLEVLLLEELDTEYMIPIFSKFSNLTLLTLNLVTRRRRGLHLNIHENAEEMEKISDKITSVLHLLKYQKTGTPYAKIFVALCLRAPQRPARGLSDLRNGGPEDLSYAREIWVLEGDCEVRQYAMPRKERERPTNSN